MTEESKTELQSAVEDKKIPEILAVNDATKEDISNGAKDVKETSDELEIEPSVVSSTEPDREDKQANPVVPTNDESKEGIPDMDAGLTEPTVEIDEPTKQAIDIAINKISNDTFPAESEADPLDVVEVDVKAKDRTKKTQTSAKSNTAKKSNGKSSSPVPDTSALVPGTVVLAKVKGFPAWPGIVCFVKGYQSAKLTV